MPLSDLPCGESECKIPSISGARFEEISFQTRKVHSIISRQFKLVYNYGLLNVLICCVGSNPC